MIPDYYITVAQRGTAEFKDRGSRFIAICLPVNDVVDCKEKLVAVKKEHAKATHHCFAYRLGLDGLRFRVSDDGEPSGTAGRPILGQIDAKQMTNVLVIVVRYFGGSLLGVPGLINAYKTSAALALQVTPTVQRPVLIEYRLQFDYTQMNDVMKIVKQYDCQVNKQESNLFSQLEIGLPVSRTDEILYRFNELRSIEITKI